MAGIGESLDIALRQPHRSTNVADEILEVIDVRRGDCLSGDDIVRLEYDYGR